MTLVKQMKFGSKNSMRLPGIFLLLILTGQSAYGATINDVRLWQHPDYTRLVFELSASIEHKLFMVANPDRIVISMTNVVMLPDLSTLDFSGSPVADIRSGVQANNDLHIVLEMRSSGSVRYESFLLPADDKGGNRLVVDLYSNEATAEPKSQPSLARPSVQERREIVIAIDAGHGGSDPGTLSADGKIKEKNVALAISRALFNSLKGVPGYKPVMIRDGDYKVDLDRRPEIAREHRADFFITIHTNSVKNRRTRGLIIYNQSNERSERDNARHVADTEEGTELLIGVESQNKYEDDLALTLVSLFNNWSLEQSGIAGSHILAALEGVVTMNRNTFREHSLEVLKSPDVPSLLIETGFLSNASEARKLTDPAYQRRMADAIATGLMNYFYETPPLGSLIAWQKDNGYTPATYTVVRGDSLSMIAQRFSVNLARLKTVNKLRSNTIRVGQILTIPGSAVLSSIASEHTVSRGETLSGIAGKYRISLSNLRGLNNLRNDRLLVGQILKIPNS